MWSTTFDRRWPVARSLCWIVIIFRPWLTREPCTSTLRKSGRATKPLHRLPISSFSCTFRRRRDGSGLDNEGVLSHFEHLDYLERVATIFAAMDFPYLRRIDATATLLTVQEHIWQAVAALLARTAHTDSPGAQEDTA